MQGQSHPIVELASNVRDALQCWVMWSYTKKNRLHLKKAGTAINYNKIYVKNSACSQAMSLVGQLQPRKSTWRELSLTKSSKN